MLRKLLRLQNWARLAGFVTIFLSVIVCSFLYAISYPPLPSGRPIAEHNNAGTYADPKPTSDDQRGTKAVPLAVEVVPPKEGTAEAERYERESLQKSANERGLAVATWILAYATLFLFAVAIGQAVMFFFQLRIMRDGMKDATIAAQAARDGAIAANAANLLNREIFVASQRPWLDAEVVLASGFRCDGKTGIVDIQVTVRNVGKVPAFNIVCRSLTFPNMEVGSDLDHYRRLSESMKSQTVRGTGFGRMLFPEKEIPISRAWTAATWHQSNIDIGNAKGATLQMGALGICICVDYLSAVDDRHYQAGFIYWLMTKAPDDEPGTWMGFALDVGNIPQDRLWLAPHPLGSQAV